MNEIIERVKFLRKIKKITQEDFAKKIGISRSNLGNIEYGRVSLTDRNINSICQVFNVNEDWLRNGVEPIFNENELDLIQKMVNEYNLNEIDELILTNFLKLDSTERKQVIDSASRLFSLLSPKK